MTCSGKYGEGFIDRHYWYASDRKTSLAEIFSREQIKVVSVKDLAEEFGYLGDLDPGDGSKEIDIHSWSDEWQHNEPGDYCS